MYIIAYTPRHNQYVRFQANRLHYKVLVRAAATACKRNEQAHYSHVAKNKYVIGNRHIQQKHIITKLT